MSTMLQNEVWSLDRCSGCGACVAACSKGVLYWGSEQHPLLEERQKRLGLSQIKLRTCEVCERFCELSCPRLVDRASLEPTGTLSARSAGVVQSGERNDVIRALLVAARCANLIDGAITLDIDPWTLEPTARVATSVDEIVSSAGVQYLWGPVLDALNEAVYERELRRLAVVGVPCVAQAVHRIVHSDNQRLSPYRQAIRVTISAFCTGTYVPSMVADLLERGMGIKRERISGIRSSVAEGILKVSLWDGEERTVPITDVEPFTRKGCGTCDDYLGEAADISVGTVGAQPGYATLITRTLGGEVFLQNAIMFGLLETTDVVDQNALDSARADKDRRSRAEAFDEFRILLLDSLSDPKKRAEVRKAYVELYGVPGEASERSKAHVVCSGC
jgi:coenzyme F420 hydrogenase subunit beta